MEYLEFIINSGLLSEVKIADLISAFDQLKISSRTYQKDEPIYVRGDMINKICFVNTGSVRGELTYTNGDVHISSFFEQNSIFGLDAALSRTTKSPIDFISNEETTIVFVSVHSILKSDYALEMYRALTYKLSDESIRTSHKVEMLSRRRLRNRILMFLNIIKKNPSDNAVTIRMSREHMADFLCVNRSALSNELSKMQREGIIEIKGQQIILK